MMSFRLLRFACLRLSTPAPIVGRDDGGANAQLFTIQPVTTQSVIVLGVVDGIGNEAVPEKNGGRIAELPDEILNLLLSHKEISS